MFKKAFAAIAVAGLLVLGGAGAASADYPSDVTVTAGSATITVGGSTAVTASGLGDLQTVFFAVSGGTGGSLSSIVLASGGGSTVEKSVTDGSATATFTASAVGTYNVSVSDGETTIGQTTITVTAAGTSTGGSGGSGELPATGGTVPAAFVWLGVGAIGLGGIAVAAAVARRRAAGNR
ncbi:LPXTG cell wall anchor domain-containing protein [Microbacterium sp. NPDC056569]|uniref:LPXTG cell wall anchor domain-containing protein n=1 Tax=Microbacterium sp. NPDC056569 TaxID=3345867 RepID=UPI00366F6B53